MKRFLSLVILVTAIYGHAYSQLNMELLSQVQYDESLSDIWGWADPETGVEYAIVGVFGGVSLVSLEDPENATEVAFIPGANSIWRDIKTWGNYAYITNETAGGLMVIDMSELPENAPYFNWEPNISGLGLLTDCHNLYIDEFGFCYLVGCNLNNGGVIILNVDTPDGVPEYVSHGSVTNAHDVYTRSNLMYLSEISDGRMAIYDVEDKNNIQLLATQSTPFEFTHNIWVNDDETVAFTTDERPDAPVAAYDITDLSNIEELDRYNPVGSLGSGVIPHNVHVWDDYLLISYYTDGGKIVDASHPDNLIEVGNFDTWLGNDGGFSGAWGLYPFLPSQTVLVSDIGNGLYVLQPTFVRACRLEGIVTNEATGQAVYGATIEIDSEQPNLATTDIFGVFKTGQAISGTFEVTFKKQGYWDKTVEVELINGELTYIEVALTPLGALYSMSGQVIKEVDGSAIPGATLLLSANGISYTANSDANGNFNIQDIVEGQYDIHAAQWGYLHATLNDILIDENTSSIVIEMEEGYQDDFFADFGWAASISQTGKWVNDVPIPTFIGNELANPNEDVAFDIGDNCFVTSNNGGIAELDDLDAGSSFLTSPLMNLTNFTDPVLNFSYWFVNSDESELNNLQVLALATNGDSYTVLNTYESAAEWRSIEDIHLKDFIEELNYITLYVIATDASSSAGIVEAGFDALLIEESATVNTLDKASSPIHLQATPNPFNRDVAITFDLLEMENDAHLQVYNAVGQLIESRYLNTQSGQLRLGSEFPTGMYWVQLAIDGEVAKTIRVVKAE